jgi:hypothetical protein
MVTPIGLYLLVNERMIRKEKYDEAHIVVATHWSVL